MTHARTMRLAAALLLAAGTAASAQSLSTGFDGSTTVAGSEWNGLFFDVTALHSSGITVTSWEVDSNQAAGNPIDVRVYVKPGSHVGFHEDPSAWILIGEVSTTSAGSGNPTLVPVGDLFIDANETYGVRIGVMPGALRYKNATQTNANPIFSNADLMIDIGNGRAQGTLWSGGITPRGWNGTVNYDIGNTVVFGACCLPDGTCADISESMCNGQGGTFQGAGTECATVPPCPKGACCLPDGSCVEVAGTGCDTLGGIYHGDGTDCATTPPGGCPQPATGACCLSDGSCLIEWEGGCLALGGLYQGDNSDCGTVTCPSRIDSHWNSNANTSGTGAGAYFLVEATDPAGIVIEAFDINTAAAAGSTITAHVYFRPNTFVGYHNDPSAWTLLGEVQTTAAGQDNPTPVPVGGLHIGGGETWALRVGSSSGVRYTSDAATDPLVTNAHVTLHMGEVQSTFFGATTFGTYPTNLRGWSGSMYYKVGATVTAGACCFPDGSCTEVREVICTGQGGTYHGDNSECATIPPCPQPGACCIPLGCTEVQENECIALGGTFEGNGVACPGNCPTPQFVVVPNANASAPGSSGLNTVLRDEPRVYQLGMAASEFQGIAPGTAITGITWRISPTASYTTWPDVPANWTRFDVQVSSSLNPIGSLSTVFDDNIAPDAVLARSGPMTIPAMTFPGGAASPNVNDFGFVIEFDNPYIYQGGDLLVTIRHDGNDTGTTRFMDSIASSPTAQAMSAIGDSNAVSGSQATFSVTLLTTGSGDPPCYADCDGNEILNIDDFLCFINEFSQAQMLPTAQQITHYANCDGSTSIPVLTIDDFLCFINEFSQGCP